MEIIKNNTDFLRLFVRNRAAVIGLTLLIIIILLALLAPFIYPENPFKTVGKPLLEPFGDFFLGTDRLGRDVAAGVVHGARTSILIASIAPMLSAIFPCAKILRAIGKGISSLSMFTSIFPRTDVRRSVGRTIGALSVFFAISPCTNIFGSVSKRIDTFPVLITIFPFTVVCVPSGVG